MLILFLCTGNSCRSQIAEGFGMLYAKPGWQVASAGSNPVGYVHPYAVKVMAEKSIDITAHSSKHLSNYPNPDVVVTLCDNAAKDCPLYPGAVLTEHWGLADPALAAGNEEAVMQSFRDTRDEIEKRVHELLTRIDTLGSTNNE